MLLPPPAAVDDRARAAAGDLESVPPLASAEAEGRGLGLRQREWLLRRRWKAHARPRLWSRWARRRRHAELCRRGLGEWVGDNDIIAITVGANLLLRVAYSSSGGTVVRFAADGTVRMRSRPCASGRANPLGLLPAARCWELQQLVPFLSHFLNISKNVDKKGQFMTTDEPWHSVELGGSGLHRVQAQREVALAGCDLGLASYVRCAERCLRNIPQLHAAR
jgi:hypothetical protein